MRILFFLLMMVLGSGAVMTGQVTPDTGRHGLVKDSQGAIIWIDTTVKEVYLVFSADERGEGMMHVMNVLRRHDAGGSFFLTGNYLRNPVNRKVIERMMNEGHFIGPHSDRHLLYATWEKRDSLLVTREQFVRDLEANYEALAEYGIESEGIRWFLAPYEWYNRVIAGWCDEIGVTLINFTHGTGTNADYTTPDMKNYRSSDQLIEGLKRFEAGSEHGLNGAIILIHPGTEPSRTDKLYLRLDEMMDYYKEKGYKFKKLPGSND
jgi:peptidoglycan/xylan/chitin deacetylase (PgdA/CDA1 family)